MEQTGGDTFNPAMTLRKRYILALSVIAILLLGSQLIIQCAIVNNDDDSRTINIAGRQRMISQKITKLALQIIASPEQSQRLALARDMAEANALWQSSYAALINGNANLKMRGNNSPVILTAYRRIEGDFEIMKTAAAAMAAMVAGTAKPAVAELQKLAQPILDHEKAFLEGMDSITFQYDKETKLRLDSIRTIEYILLIITFITLGMEAFFIFLPAERQIKLYFREMRAAVSCLEEQATHDGMTGLLNKRAGLIFLQREIEKSKRSGADLCLAFIDLDGLKTANDRLGHEEGDQLIIAFADIVRKQIRAGDVAFRFGGDEFVLVLNCSLALADDIIDRIHAQLAEINASGVHPFQFGFSCGTVAYDSTLGHHPDDFIAAADTRMYEEKARHHRNNQA